MPEYSCNWEDMSNYLVHFTKGGEGNDDFRTMLSICWQGRLTPRKKFGIGRQVAPGSSLQKAVCFSEIPPGQWNRLSNRRETRYGIAFTKQFIIDKGGGPLWYVYRGSPHWQYIQEIMRGSRGDSSAPIWKLTPLIDVPRPRYEFEWEREWRYVGDFSFDPEDVAFLLIPEERHSSARTFFENAQQEHSGPAYLCPYIDPTWERERILRTLQDG